MGISSPTISFPIDETIKRIEYVKANAMGIIHEAKKIQREVSSIRSETDADEKERIDAADGKLGDILIRFLQKSFPKDGIICEDKPTIDGGDFRWVIDPVDGSMNFVRGLPLYAISFGLEHRETPVGGVVIVPPQESVYSAVMGEGAYKNGEQIRTSRISELNRAIFSPNLPTKRAHMIQEIMADLSGFLTYARSFRRTGSFVLDSCFIAEGVMDAIWEKTVKHWDVSAISVILAEAGGKLTDLNGVHYYTGLPELVASNGVLHSEILNLLKTVRSTVSRN
ncbi:inositol monophosphatase family protein [Leptospira kanakyensis]|uniref:Inositol-1-monophosphatase n=1 Tax=Leptospira kanakyensis TaxID=2484968 RepID=A0A6N4QEB1_9LEPT|nr:inositol monophosphatase family protein [Leptospira kanakyensis]MCW7469170.1 inositol monophosphatase [Leptospira kanakyensis]MCW7480159.1 inositol monophosphatase [Leptospira kanakyensis]TGK50367.1 inositol monophosphatase [Leptospira kanakyensis]TGK64030.1 inositol monophosphatase [Leptospira kanakyensis]TGK69507.1 inositol monophosphatase [Leptospira kanakyensis]